MRISRSNTLITAKCEASAHLNVQGRRVCGSSRPADVALIVGESRVRTEPNAGPTLAAGSMAVCGPHTGPAIAPYSVTVYGPIRPRTIRASATAGVFRYVETSEKRRTRGGRDKPRRGQGLSQEGSSRGRGEIRNRNWALADRSRRIRRGGGRRRAKHAQRNDTDDLHGDEHLLVGNLSSAVDFVAICSFLYLRREA